MLTPRIDDSYWVVPGKLLAGEYPLLSSEKKFRAKLQQMLENGVTFFVNLTEEGEKGLEPYDRILQEEAAGMGLTAEHRRTSIPDFETPTVKHMEYILDTIDAALEQGHRVYIHCFAGIGRTGTVAGCFLARHGMSGEEALNELNRVKQGTGFEDSSIPVTSEQRMMVHFWPA
ncbi:MAG: hypothetical protein GY795_17030 [Desulfobacterales bacterium]|nr:hypothetical protein [Desulfobacterales bacterium]